MSILELNLSEENEIGFKLKIEGSDKDIGSYKPTIRFVVSEQNSDAGWVFNANKNDDGVSVIIPSMKGLISENKKYLGKLEVILGGRYFTPTEVDIDFVEPLKIEAAVATVSNKNNNTAKLLEENKEKIASEQELSIKSQIDSITVKENKNPSIPFKEINDEQELINTNIKSEIKKIFSYKDLDESQKEKVNKLFLDKCKQYGIEYKEVKKLMSEGTSYTKKRLTALLVQATKEFISTL